ncbi:PAS domain S-box-containing protein [Mariprofundus ferrinatatus]|uniref:histidine kinase n=1 Tax=Mariprofundus ferrinatatus TaxID=1921087 RepID=A0A2K8L6D6_9PROT|nr:GAF domain-containing protein [Mariprofundus ferrinatatus]ATX82878.1 PAS domain S-box-containing protein [Mariprofundus ferrinatatus]
MSDQKKRQLSEQEIEQLQERAKKLALEKSYFQLVMQMITRISETPGLANVINSLLINTMQILGGSNLQLYYKIDEQLHYADAMGNQHELDGFPDEVIPRVFATGWEEEIEGDFQDTHLTTSEFTKAYTWIYPLKVGNEVIAVFRMENLHLDMRLLYEQLPAFFNFAALVLKNEILGQSRLQAMNRELQDEVAVRKQREIELREAKSGLEKTVSERTAELKATNEQLSRELEERKAYMEKLAKSEKEYYALIHELQVAVVVHNFDTSIRIYNELACELLGLSPDQMEGKTAFDPAWNFMDEHGDPLDVAQYPVNRAIAEKRAVRDLILGINRPVSSDQVWVLVHANPIKGNDDEILEVVVTFIDVTARRQVEKIERARLRIFELSQTRSMDELMEQSLNEAEELTGSQIAFFHFVEEDQETLWLQNWSTRTKAEFCRAEGKGEHYAVSAAGVWADALRNRAPLIHNDYAALPYKKGMPEGHAEVKRELVVPVMRGEKVVAILGIGNKQSDYSDADVNAASFLADLVWDIVEKSRAEEQVEEMSTRFKAMTDSSPLAIYMSSGGIEQRGEYINPTFTELFGYTIEDVPSVGEWWPLAYPDEAYRKQVAEDWEKRVQTAIENSADIEPMETTVACKDGSTKRIVWGFFSSGQVDCSFGLDVTASREAEEEIRRFNAELEQLVEERTAKLNETNKRLEGFNEIMAEREMRVVEIKQEVNLLSRELGRDPPYKEVWNALQET